MSIYKIKLKDLDNKDIGENEVIQKLINGNSNSSNTNNIPLKYLAKYFKPAAAKLDTIKPIIRQISSIQNFDSKEIDFMLPDLPEHKEDKFFFKKKP